jgi:putative membrane protein
MKTTMTAVLAGLFLSLPAIGQAVMDSPSQAAAAAGDSTFLKNAAADSLAEVQLGKLAEQRATNPEVKAFGQRMVTEHGQANQELKLLAAQKDITLPGEIDAEHKVVYNRLASLSGAEFDKAYVDEMVQDHREAVAEFQKATQSGDPEVEAFASRTLPTLQKHLTLVQQLASTTGLKGVP